MYNKDKIDDYINFINSNHGIGNKLVLSSKAQETFSLVKERSVYYCEDFATRFCFSKNRHFSNTVLSLSTLQKYDNRPFIVVLLTPTINYMMLANTTFLQKISHSSQDLSVSNIRGSFNGNDIVKDFHGVQNRPENFEFLYSTHVNFSFEENLLRLVEATNNIQPIGKKYDIKAPRLIQFNYSSADFAA